MALPLLPDIAAVPSSTTHLAVRTKVNEIATSVTILSRKFVRSFSLADMVTGYATNVPLLVANNADPDKFSPEAQSYGTNNSAPALYDLVTQVGAAYQMTGAEIIIPTGFWALGSKPAGASADYIIPMLPRLTFRGETGNPENCALTRTNAISAHLFRTVINTADGGTAREPAGVNFYDLTINGNWVNGPAIEDYDCIHWEKPTNGAWFDSYLKVVNCKVEKAKRHCIYVKSRGDIRIEKNRLEGSGDSAFKAEDAPDSHFNDNHIVAAGRWSVELLDSTNWEIKNNIAYFGGQNQMNRWDGTNADSIRLNGGGFMINNCGSIRGNGNRIEDTTGHGLILRSPGGVEMLNTYFSSPGTQGARAETIANPRTKQFTVGSGNITATVNGVDLVYFDKTQSNGNKLGDGVKITGSVHSARDWQQVRHIVNIDAPDCTWRPGRDISVEIEAWPDEFGAEARNVDETAAWNAVNQAGDNPVKYGSFWVSPGRLVANTYPTVLERSVFKWKGELIPEIHGRAYYLRKMRMNPFDEEIYFNINTASVSSSCSAATWSGGTNSDKAYAVTYTVASNLTATLNTNHAVRISGMSNAANNGVFNIKAITTNSITVHNLGRLDASADESGSSGTIVGPSPALVLDVGHPGRVYDVRVAKSASTESLRVYTLNMATRVETLLTTISAAGTTKVRKTPLGGWAVV